MAKHWEITGRLGELQMEWLRKHYDEETLEYALRKVPRKGFPLNVARWLQQHRGGPPMPHPAELLRDDPVIHESSREVVQAALEKARKSGV